MQGLTKRQREIVDFIEGYLTEKKYSPSYRDIQRHFGFASLGSVYNHVQSLKKKGMLPTDTERSRSLTPINRGETIAVPLLGTFRGGMPIETFPHRESVPIAAHLVPTSEHCYLLRVIGKGLEEESIQEGDLLLIHSTQDFEEGSMALLQVGPQTTLVKRAFREPPYIRLESGNPQVHPMVLRQEHIKILGIVLLLIRNYL